MKGIKMLVLTRKRAEMIKIGDDIKIKVIRTGRGSVKIGIEAPAHVRVLRAELCDEPVDAKPQTPLKSSDRLTRETVDCCCSDQFPHIA